MLVLDEDGAEIARSVTGSRYDWLHLHGGARYDVASQTFAMGVGNDHDLGDGRSRTVNHYGIATGTINASFREWQYWASQVALYSPMNHTGLDLVGFIPGVGEIADGLNGLIYLAEGDTTNAAISFAAAVAPFGGDALKLTRLGKLAAKGLGHVADGVHAAAGVNRKLLSRSFSAGVHGVSGAVAGGAITTAIDGPGAFWDGAFIGGASGAIRGFVQPYICFVAGTQVVTGVEPIDDEQAEPTDTRAGGNENARAGAHEHAEAETATTTRSRVRYLTTSIEDIAVGDLVLAKPEEDPHAEPRLCRVAEVYRRTSDHLRVLTIHDSEGWQQTLKTTDDHPFYIDNAATGESGWVNACKLVDGDQLLQPDGSRATVITTAREEHPGGVPVFNFHVTETLTYFVREKHSTGQPIWVHNADYKDGVVGTGKLVDAGNDTHRGSALANGQRSSIHDSLPVYGSRGRKTSGTLSTDVGDAYLVSGRGPGSNHPRLQNYVIKDHVEIHSSAIMKDFRIREGTLYINKQTCYGGAGCADFLADVLPDDALLHVVSPQGRVTYYGGYV